MTERIFTDYVRDILDAIKEIDQFTQNMSFEDFSKDKKTINAVLRSLSVVGEAARKIPEKLRIRHSDIPWNKMTGMRDKLVHEYFGIDLEIVWQTIRKDLAFLEPLIKRMLSDLS